MSPNPTPDPVFQAALDSTRSLAAGEIDRVRYQADLPFAAAMERLAEQHPDVISIKEDRPVYVPPDYAAQLRSVMPREPEQALPIKALAERLGWGVDHVQEAMIPLGRNVLFSGKNGTVRYWFGTG